MSVCVTESDFFSAVGSARARVYLAEDAAEEELSGARGLAESSVTLSCWRYEGLTGVSRRKERRKADRSRGASRGEGERRGLWRLNAFKRLFESKSAQF